MAPHGSASAFGLPRPMDYLRMLYRRRWLVGGVVVAVLAGAAAYTFTAERLYEAQTTLVIESGEPNVVSFEDVLDERRAQGDYYQTQYQLLMSGALATRTVEHLSPAAREQMAAAGASPLTAVRQGLRITPVRGSRMVAVRFQSPDPDVAAEVANTHARQYIEQSLDIRFQASRDATDWLTGQLEDERRRVERSESALQAFREQHDAVSLTDGQDIIVQKLADLNAAVTTAKTKRIEAEAQYRELAALQKEPAALDSHPAILGSQFIQQLKGDLSRLQREHSQLSETLGERHPTLLAKRSEVQTIERRLTTEVARIVESAQNAYRSAAAEETSLARALEEQKGEALALNRRGIEYAALEREAESVRLVYQSLLQRAKETSVSRELRSTNIRIIDAAQPPRQPVSPRTADNLLIALLGGSLLGVACAFGLEYFDDRIRTPDELRRHLPVEFLGLLPAVGADHSFHALRLLEGDVPASLAEAVRALRTNILFALQGKRPASIVVASPGEHDGKTFVAASLAVALAQARQRVLLVDADMRRPRLHEVVDERLEPGLSNVLAGTAALRDVLRPTALPDLTVMTAGTPSGDAPELLGSPLFEDLFNILQEHYSWVIVDSPPVLNVTDASVMATRASGVLLVVASGKTTSRTATLAIEELQRTGGQIIGAVLNRAALEQHPFYFAPYVRGEYRVDTPPVTTGEPQVRAALGKSA